MKIYQGNDKFITFVRVDNNGKPIVEPPQKIWFTVKKTFEDEIVFQKTYQGAPDDSISLVNPEKKDKWQVHISSSDTDNLEIGDYVCDLKIRNEKGYEFTIMKPQKFTVLPAVTLNENEGNPTQGGSTSDGT